MRKTYGNYRKKDEFIGDMYEWMRQNAEDNSETLERLQRNLRLAQKRELTVRQRQVLQMYFERKMRVTEIAMELSLSKSTVSRTIDRAKAKLYRFLRYSF